MGLGTATVTDEQIRGPLRVGHTVQARHSEKKEFIEATISKIQDCSQYTVVFDDGDITTLRRTALCLKSGRHFNESETLDQLPLTHPEHFGNPVVGGRRGRRSRQLKEDSSEGEPEEETEPDLDLYSGDIGRVVCVEGNEKKKSKENWFPGLVVVPSAQPTVRINVREEYLIRSFKDGRYYTVPKKEISEFSRDMGARIESTVLADAMNKALQYLDRDELPVHWERGTLFDLQIPDSDSDENYSDSSDDEPREEKDHFVAQLYKFMDDRGTPLNKSPMIANRDVDLYRLFRVVHKLGGYNRVTNQSKWRSVTIRLGYHQNLATYNSVKQAYKKYLFSFEEFYRKLGCTMINHPRNAKKHRGRSLIRDRDRATPVNSSPRPDRGEDSIIEPTPPPPPEKKEEEKPAQVPRPKSSLSKKVMVVEKEEETKKEKEKEKKKEILETSDSSSSSNSSEGTIDVQSDSGQSTSKKEETKKKPEVKPPPPSVKERKVKAAGGEKVKALVEQFEEQTKKEKQEPPPVKEDDKIQQTRSKSQGPKVKEAPSPDRKDVASTSRIQKTPKKQEEDKRRGRKRKDTLESEPKVQETTPEATTPSTQPVSIGDKLKVYYGPTHESKVTYEAKVLDIEKNSTGIVYRVHYTGWNTRYDEWIKPARIAENLSNTTKAKRLKQSLTPGKATPTKPAGKRGRGQSVSSSRSQEPPRSTTPSSVTSSSSRTKSPATPASSKTASSSRITRGGGADNNSGPSTNRRTRKTSVQTDLSILSDSDSDSDQSESELSRTRSGSKTDEVRRRGPHKRKEKDDDDTEKEDDDKPIKRLTKRKKSPEPKSSAAESDEDSSSPPKGRDFDLNQIRSELKGFEKAVKLTSTEAAALDVPEDKQTAGSSDTTSTSTTTTPAKSSAAAAAASEKKSEEKAKQQSEKSLSTEDIYEFKEPEPFELEPRTSKMNEDKSTKKRLVPRVFEEVEKSPKKKGGKSPPKSETKDEDKKRTFKRTPVKKIEDDEEKTPVKEEVTPVKSSRPVSSCEDPFDKLVGSPSFNIGHSLSDKKSSPPTEVIKSKVVKSLNMDETLSLFSEIPETVGDDSRDRLDMSDTDDTQTEPLFSHKEPIFSDSTFNKPESSGGLDPIFRGFTGSVKCGSGDEAKKRSIKDGQSDEDDSITAAIQRAISNTMTDEDSTGDDLFITQPTTIYQSKMKTTKEENKPTTSTSTSTNILTTTTATTKKETTCNTALEDVKEPLSINTKEDTTKEQKETKDVTKPKQISPALQETDSSLLEAISLQTEMLKKEETREPQIKIGTKIADSILQKFNMIKKNEEIKPLKIETKIEPPIQSQIPKIEKLEEPPVIKKEIKIEPEIKVKEIIPEVPIISEPIIPEIPIEIKKRSNKKVVSREFIEESDTDSTDSEERLVIARSEDDDSQTTPSEKLDFKDTDSNASAIQANTDDSQECERNFKLDTIKCDTSVIESVVEQLEAPKVELEPVKTAEEEPESNISLLLCKETIPGSPAPVPEMSPASTETRTKPKSAKSLLLEMPFASAPGSSNSKGMLGGAGGGTNQVELITAAVAAATSSSSSNQQSLQQKQSSVIQKDPQPLAVPLEQTETNETTPVIDNTPPTTPESTISNLSPRGDQDRISPNTADNESCKSTDSGQRAQSTSKITHYSEEDTLMTTEQCPAPKKPLRSSEESAAAPCRKRRRSCKASDVDVLPVKRGRKPNVRNIRANSDSDDTSEHSAHGSTPPAGGLTPNAATVTAVTIETRMSSRSPRPSKFNFIIELDPSMECGQRISILTQKLSELRKTYNNVKTELACIDRRRKKLRRREREALKASKQEMACS